MYIKLKDKTEKIVYNNLRDDSCGWDMLVLKSKNDFYFSNIKKFLNQLRANKRS
jgi:hypothetical protein